MPPTCETDFSKRIGLKVPLILAPMAGGPSSVDLVAAASNAGALGSIGAAYTNPAGIREFTEKVRAKTERPIAVNLFIQYPEPKVSPAQMDRAISAMAAYREELGLPKPQIESPFEESFEAQFAQVLELRPAVFSFVFGLLEEKYLREARERGIYLIGTATSVAEAEALAASGVDAITLQGIEAGGHRGIFDVNGKDPEVPALQLLEQCAKKIKIPLIAAGGIMNRAQIGQALAFGAQAVQLGSLFLACKEAGTSAPYRKALLAGKRETKTTRVFSGRLARGLKNRFMTEMEAKGPEARLPFPAQNKFTRDLRTASAKRDSADFLSLWVGTGAGELPTGSCAEIMENLFGG